MCLDLGRIYDFSDNSSHILNYLIKLVMTEFIEKRYVIEYNNFKHFETVAKAAAEAKAVTETDDAAEAKAAAEANAVTEGNAAAEAKAAAEAPNAKKDAYRLEYRIAIKMDKNVDVASAQAKKVEDELYETEKKALNDTIDFFRPSKSGPEVHARAWGLQTKGRSRTKVFNFFNVTNDTDLKTKFSIDFKRLLQKPDDEVYGFSSLLSDDNKRKFVYETLIFIAFIDGITNTCRYGVIDKSIQFSHVLRRVFHSINGDELFSNFDIFLSKFTIDYDEFCRLNPDLVANMNIALDEISRRLAVMLGACPSRHYPPSYFILPPDSSVLGEVEVEDNVVPLSRYGGSKRLRRRNSNKKRNHKSRNKQTRRRRRRNSTRRRVTRHH
jgi:chemotaxis protein histidine kinase CheA